MYSSVSLLFILAGTAIHVEDDNLVEQIEVIEALIDDGSGPPPIVICREGEASCQHKPCPADSPLRIDFFNASEYEVRNVTFDVAGTLADSQRNFVVGGKAIESKNIIPANMGIRTCWPVQVEPSVTIYDLDYSVTVTRAN